MPIFYAVKHVFRSWKLFLALLIGITLASAFFAGIDIKANATAKQAMEQQLRNVYVDMQANIQNLSNLTKLLTARDKVLGVSGVMDAEIISRVFWVQITILGEDSEAKEDMARIAARIAAITNYSQVYKGWLNRPTEEIGENETYIPENTALASMVKVNDVIQVNFSTYDTKINIPLNLTVKGFAQLDDRAAAIASGYQQWLFQTNIVSPTTQMDFLLLVSWEKTMQKILPSLPDVYRSYGWMETSLLVYIDRDVLINPWDIGTSLNNIEKVKNSIQDAINSHFGSSAISSIQNNLEWPLRSFQFASITIRFMFTLVSLPIFFMAWYMGTTVSDVSFNLRRREIGLLLTKGFSRGQILRIFLTETLLIGLVGGSLGVFLGFLLNPLFTQFSTDALFNLNLISPFTVSFTIAFGVIMALLSAYSSARKASQLPTVEALREYLPMEMEKPYKKRWPLVALILGTYKIAVFLSGVNMTAVLTRIMFGGGNFILMLLVGIFMFVDAILNYIGPLLFFWGFTKMFIQGSLEFQQLTAKVAKFFGDLGVLATKNVRRNPARSAAIAFLIALIVGYSVQVNGQLASEQDYAMRRIYYQVGADIAVTVPNANNAPEILDAIMANVSEFVYNATIEYSFSRGNILIKAVDPNSWLKTAYYESEWFSGTDVTTAFNNLAADNHTIILERSVAESYANLTIGDNLSLFFDSQPIGLRVVGFFGPSSESQSQIYPLQISISRYWSYVSQEFLEEISTYVSPSARILLKLKSGADGKLVANKIRSMNLDITQVQSFAEDWEKAQENVITMGTLDVQRLGIVFAVLAASAGTALISIVSLKERSREATIMSVKGLSYKQLVIMFLTENLALVTFSVILGILVGVITVYGNISSSNAMILELVKRRLVFPLDTTLMLTSCLALIFAATILPILIMSRRYVTKLERMVRLR
ncbi:MAG: FtsX-like permease family protein [Candidatus Bathyarchaeota archaeon]|jgi:ABC-type antimicrobial peptide transport system permease subunit|nr:FtsX-like permease family protein [Candidatus Bathyarchaeota archaeon]